MEEGYIPISRKLFEHPFWSEKREFSYAEAWIDILRLVRFEANSTKMLIGGKAVEIHRGEYPASLRRLADLWGWSKNKVDKFLDLLISEGMITKRTAEGTKQTVITVCNFDKYNIIPKNPGQLAGQNRDNVGTTSGQRRDKSNKDNNINNINNNIPPTPQEGDVASGKTWRDDFDIYLSEVTEAFEKISSDKEFIKNRQKYHPELDIVLSLKKAFEDYWNQEAGWKRKKISKTKNIDWVSTFKKALDQPQNKVYKQRNVNPEPEQLTPLQERFRKFLEDNGPLLLKMPSQPTDQEVESLAKMNKSMLTDIVRKINNDSYITRYKNSVYQTIMEIKKKEYG